MSKLEVDKITPQSGTTLTIGEAGDTTVVNGLGTLPATIGSAAQVLSVNAGATGLVYGTAVTDLSNLNATNLTSGTVPDARFPSTLPTANGQNLTSLSPANLQGGTFPAVNSTNLTNLNATAITSGTLPDGRFPATLPAISGANLTNLPGGNTPAFNIDLNATQNVSSLTSTKVALNTARIDTDSGFDSSNNRWTVPSGKGGTYYVGFELNGASGNGSSQLNFLACELKINGSSYIGTNIDFRSNPARECKVNANFIIALSAGDYLEIFGNNYVVGGQAYFGGGNSNAERNKSHLYGFKIT